MSDMWTIKLRAGGGYKVLDEAGETLGSYMTTEVAAAHHASALRQNRQMRALLEKCLHLIEKGFEVRVEDQWPALTGPMQDCKKSVRDFLFPEMQRIEITKETQ